MVNIKNKDDKYLIRSFSAAFKWDPHDHHKERVSHYWPYENKLNMREIKMPMAVEEDSQILATE